MRKLQHLIPIGMLLVVPSVAAVAQASEAESPPVETFRGVAYVDEPHTEQHLDSYWPQGDPQAISTVVFLHGGSLQEEGERRSSPLYQPVCPTLAVPADLVIVPGKHFSSIRDLRPPGDPTFATAMRFLENPAQASSLAAGGGCHTYHEALASERAILSSLAREIPGLLDEAEVPGVAIAVVGNGALRWSGAFGRASSATGASIPEDAVFEAASLSKPVFAYLVMRLVDQGRFSLDAPIASILPPSSRLDHEDRYGLLTPRILLSHRSGLPNWGGERLDLAFDPGTRFSYSGEGFVLLQRAVEEVTGSSLEELARKEVFTPLGMGSSSYVWQESFAERAAAGHDRLGRPRPINRPEEPNAAHSLLTTAPDLARFVAAVLESRGLPLELRDAMLTPVVDMRGDELASPRPRELWEKIAWALGWGVQRSGDRTLFWHWGDNGAFRSLLAGDLATGAGLVLLTNSENGLSVAAEIARPIVGEVHWTTEWLGYDSHDSPEVAAVRDLRRRFVEGSPAAGLERYHALRKGDSGVADLEVALRTAADLTALDRIDAALELLDAARPHHPGSAELLTRLGTTRVAAGDVAAALESYEQARALADDDDELSDLIAWTRGLAEAEAHPVTITPARLEALTGSYGPRRVTKEGNDLFYRRGEGTRYWLIPVSADTFALEGLAGFRIRFVDDESGRPVKIIGEYAGGATDETPRSDD